MRPAIKDWGWKAVPVKSDTSGWYTPPVLSWETVTGRIRRLESEDHTIYAEARFNPDMDRCWYVKLCLPGGGNQSNTYTETESYAQRWAEKKVLTWFQREYEKKHPKTCTQYLEHRDGWQQGVGLIWSYSTDSRNGTISEMYGGFFAASAHEPPGTGVSTKQFADYKSAIAFIEGSWVTTTKP